MTLPGLMGRYREVVMVNKLKRAYAEIVNAMDMERARLGVKKQFADQHSGYGAMFDTMRTGKLTYERYDISDKF